MGKKSFLFCAGFYMGECFMYILNKTFIQCYNISLYCVPYYEGCIHGMDETDEEEYYIYDQ